MKVGFTGTREGMTDLQSTALAEYLRRIKGSEFHHGDCRGADQQAHDIASDLGLRIVIHPPRVDTARAWCVGDEMRTPLDYIERNRRIVKETQILVAMPRGLEEEVRSGTWATVRYARKQWPGCVTILWPDGLATEEARG